jgi:threonine synthase
MDRATAVECETCGQRLLPTETHRCDGDAPATLTVVHDFERVREQFDPAASGALRAVDDHWRYGPLLPVADAESASLGEGGTDLVDAPTLSGTLGVDFGLKLEGANPTGSTKDRGSSVLVAHAVERDSAGVVAASTGNAAASLAAYAARRSLDCQLFVPESVPAAKALQPRIYGADLTTVEGSYDDAYARCRAVAGERGWVDRSAGASPYTAAGARTLGYELAEQTPAVPDWVVVPVGNGGTIAGAYRGFETFADLGFVPDTPRMLGVQTAATSPIHDEVHGDPDVADASGTCADSIDVGTPHRGGDAREAIVESGGTTVVVDDDAIRAATARLGRREGVFVEPACAAALAGVERALADGTVDRGDSVVAVMTGTGLKDTDTAQQVVDR